MAKFGAYEILYELKKGGMGSVLLGRRRGPGTFEQLVAIKTIRPEYGHVEAVRAMFLDEAAILAKLSHPGIATVHDFGEEAGTLYMVMEYVAGIPFRDFADLDPPPTIAAKAIAEAARGLHAAHEVRDMGGNTLGVVHRDISPDNLMLGFDGHVKVIDFGIALVKNRQAPVTEFGTVKGKPPYMSPEQVKNETMDRRSDVFSLAVVLHELLTRAPLFDGDSIYAIARAVEHQVIYPPSHVANKPLPLGLDAAVLNALDRDVARRTPTAAAFAEELEQVVAAAGDESLESWAARELAGARDAHRQWLASVVIGETPGIVGRPTGSVTALGPQHLPALGKAATQLAPVAPAQIRHDDQPPEPGASTHLAADTGDEIEALPRRGYVGPILLALLVLLAIGGGIWMLRNSATTTTRSDAGIVETRVVDGALDTVVVTVPPDVAIDAEEQVDAAIDARIDAPHRTVPRDGSPRTPPRDAPTAPPVVDAPSVPTGTGKLTVKHRDRPGESFKQVLVDGRYVGDTPLYSLKLDAGQHTVELVQPDTKAVVYKEVVDLQTGTSKTVVQQ